MKRSGWRRLHCREAAISRVEAAQAPAGGVLSGIKRWRKGADYAGHAQMRNMARSMTAVEIAEVAAFYARDGAR